MIIKFIFAWAILSVSSLLIVGLVIGLFRLLSLTKPLEKRAVVVIILHVIFTMFVLTLIWIGFHQSKWKGLADVPWGLAWILSILFGLFLFKIIDSFVVRFLSWREKQGEKRDW